MSANQPVTLIDTVRKVLIIEDGCPAALKTKAGHHLERARSLLRSRSEEVESESCEDLLLERLVLELLLS